MKRLLKRMRKISFSNMSWLLRGVGGAVLAGAGYKLGEDLYRFIKKRVGGAEQLEPERADDPDRGSY